MTFKQRDESMELGTARIPRTITIVEVREGDHIANKWSLHRRIHCPRCGRQYLYGNVGWLVCASCAWGGLIDNLSEEEVKTLDRITCAYARAAVQAVRFNGRCIVRVHNEQQVTVTPLMGYQSAARPRRKS